MKPLCAKANNKLVMYFENLTFQIHLSSIRLLIFVFGFPCISLIALCFLSKKAAATRRRGSRQNIVKRHFFLSIVGNVTQRGKGSLEIARSSNGVAGKESLLGVEPLNSILEQDDVERYLDADQVQEVTKLQDSISHVSMDNLYLSDADDADRFDTDLEEDFPGNLIFDL